MPFDVFYHALASLACEQSPKACLKRSASVDRPLTEPPQHPTDADMRPFKVRVELGRSHMCEYGACRGAEQRLGPSNPRVELVVESKRRRRRPPRPSHPRVHLVVEPHQATRRRAPEPPQETRARAGVLSASPVGLPARPNAGAVDREERAGGRICPSLAAAQN